MLTDQDLQAISARAEAATEGPLGSTADEVFAYDADETVLASAVGFADAAFIAAARQDVPALVREVRAMRAVLKSVEWAGHVKYDWEETAPACPCCDGLQPDDDLRKILAGFPFGHAPDCALAAALGRV